MGNLVGARLRDCRGIDQAQIIRRRIVAARSDWASVSERHSTEAATRAGVGPPGWRRRSRCRAEHPWDTLRTRRARSGNARHLRTDVDGPLRGYEEHSTSQKVTRPLRRSIRGCTGRLLPGNQRGGEEYPHRNAWGCSARANPCTARPDTRGFEHGPRRLLEDRHGGRGTAHARQLRRRRRSVRGCSRDGPQ